MYVVCKYLKKRNIQKAELYAFSSRRNARFHYSYATKIFRTHKDIKECLEKHKDIDENIMRSNINFQECCFDICKCIYDVIKQKGCEEATVTVFQRFNKRARGKNRGDYVTVVAYAGKDDYKYKSYRKNFYYSESGENHDIFVQTMFYRLFQNEHDMLILNGKKKLKKNFAFLVKARIVKEISINIWASA